MYLSNTYIRRGSDEYHQIIDRLNYAYQRRGDIGDLGNILINFYSDNKITEDGRSEYNETFREITHHIKQIYPNANVCLYGSHVNGLANKDSDLDITILFEKQFSWGDSKSDKRRKLSAIYIYLVELQRYLNLHFIATAKIPIVKFKTIKDISVDISIDNLRALQNTDLLMAYSDYSSYVFVLGQLLKHVINFYDIANVYEGTLSPFGYMLMLIHFLQKNDDVPIIRKKNYDRSFDLFDWDTMYPYKRITMATSNCRRSYIAKLWIGFFKYYTMKFDIKNDVISIIHSERVSKSEKGWTSSCLAIEDPLDPHINVASHIKLSNFEKIFDSFIDVLENKGDINKIYKKQRRNSFSDFI